MNIWSVIKRISLKEIGRLLKIGLSHPLYIIPTYKATHKTLRICHRLYPKTQHAHGVENAFRHALWNMLLCQYIFEVNNTIHKSLEWTKKITDLHEELAPNNELEKAMDLHNNKVGRNIFGELLEEEENQIIVFLQEKMKTAHKISDVSQLKEVENELIYISEFKV